VKTTLPTLIDTKIKIDPGKIIMAGGSAGGNSVERGGKGRPLQHSFDASDMGGSETSGLEKMFAKRVWDEFLGPLIA
jgi:hypothetical protein